MGNLSKYRLSLKFSEKDPDQTEVVNLLKQMGRRKSLFITKAIKYYLEKEPEAEIPMPKARDVDRDQMKKLIKELLIEIGPDGISPAPVSAQDKKIEEIKTPIQTVQMSEEQDEETNNDIDDFLSGLEGW